MVEKGISVEVSDTTMLLPAQMLIQKNFYQLQGTTGTVNTINVISMEIIFLGTGRSIYLISLRRTLVQLETTATDEKAAAHFACIAC